MAYGIGGGGGRVPGFTENPRFSLSKPADLTDLTDPGQVNQLDEMLRELYASHRLLYQVLEDGGIIGDDGAASSGSGDVVGPSSAVTNQLAMFDGTTGKLIADSGYTAASLIAGVTGTLSISVKDLTELEIESLATTPVLHIAAGDADQIRVPIRWIVQGNVTTAYSSSPNLRIRWGFPTTGTPDIFTPQSIGFTSAGRKALFSGASSMLNNTLAEYKGTAVSIDASANPGTPLTGVATARSMLYYVTLTAAY